MSNDFTKKVKFCDIPLGTFFSITGNKKDLRVFEKMPNGAIQIIDSLGVEVNYPIYPYLDMLVYIREQKGE